MVIKVYVSLISCNQEIKKNQQRTIMILESKNIPYVAIDITDPSQEEAKEYMTTTAVPKPNAKVPVTPQIFNEADYCGDFDQLDMANECDTLGDFLKLSEDEKKLIKIGITGILPEDRKKAQERQKEDPAPLANGVPARESSVEKNGDLAAAPEEAAVEEASSPATEEAPQSSDAPSEEPVPPEAEVLSAQESVTTEASVEPPEAAPTETAPTPDAAPVSAVQEEEEEAGDATEEERPEAE
ncbi:SH3 domain-binding glutamic acid-rich protein homolog isoform X2 [Hyalella azteca]|uniref:SH3 domain-binding glutamic acid-rich protein homolog isoform X2 n=1 Tax=Hyalella azteca TaxID=294128 RepID=A0A8B7N1D8_HYAAZ|nr:SH3 domain-binding glutamic acid-rich protein homolog isoform X2 [Hyalella azteca]